MKTKATKGGFTLVEVLIASSILMIVMLSIMSLFDQSSKALYSSEWRMMQSTQIKKFSEELVAEASRSNQFLLFKSAVAADRDGPNAGVDANNSDRQVITGATPALHPAGDFVVFIYYEYPKPTTSTYCRILRLEGYYLDSPDSDNIGTVRKVLVDLSTVPYTTTTNTATAVEDVLTTYWNGGVSHVFPDGNTVTFTPYFKMARGLCTPENVDGTDVRTATGVVSRLFYKRDVRNIIVAGQVYSNSYTKNTKDKHTYTNSFNFTITPRT